MFEYHVEFSNLGNALAAIKMTCSDYLWLNQFEFVENPKINNLIFKVAFWENHKHSAKVARLLLEKYGTLK